MGPLVISDTKTFPDMIEWGTVILQRRPPVVLRFGYLELFRAAVALANLPVESLKTRKNQIKTPTERSGFLFWISGKEDLNRSERRANARKSAHGWARKRAKAPVGARQDAERRRESPLRRYPKPAIDLRLSLAPPAQLALY